ncbi:MAG TPA: amidohydrolase family protein [Gemmatimonadales bacterium]|nr:amidohydrolase family protein [Gemmatimonadales bacterium]
MSDRRTFIVTTGSASLGLTRLPALIGLRKDADLVIRNGTLFDGTGAAGVELDLAITGGRISAIGPRLRDTGREEIDARGMAVAPGFIDIHSHADSNLPDDPRAESVIRQGVTTVVVGADGDSDATGSPARPFGAYWEAVRGWRPAVNVASMVGLGAIRGEKIGDADRPATDAEVREMTAWVVRAIAEGACGASSGLEYTPGGFASTAELGTCCAPLAAARLPYATHMRNEDDRVLEAIEESIAVARLARCPLQISHLKMQGPRNWSKLDQAFARVAEARRAGIDAAFDRYPYVAYQTGLTNLFPLWSRDGGTDAFLGRLVDTAVEPRIREAVVAKVALIGGWDNVMVTSVRDSTDRAVEGKRLGSYAQGLGADPYEMTKDLLRRSRGGVGMVGFAMSEENLDRILAHPQGMVCSDGGSFAIDGPTRRGSPHPRGAGSFPRVLARYVRERKALTLAAAIHKMSGLPASRLRLRDRGRLVRGCAGDVVVFDPATVADRATFEDPFQYPVGISAVVVNGTVALRDGARTDAGRHAGSPVRPGR